MSTYTRSYRRHTRPAAPIVLSLAAVLMVGGCIVHDRPLETQLAPAVQVPPRSVVMLFADGLSNEMLDAHLARGTVPNIKRYIIDRALRYRRTLAGMPSITYASTATLITGQAAGRHGVVGNRWFDPYTLRYQSYGYIKTYRAAEHDLQAPTIYELLHDRFTVSIQVATRRGVTRKIDNWTTSGISWFFGQYANVDKLTAMRFELIADLANRTGRWPTFILAYFPAGDEIAHRHGVTSRFYQDAVGNLDEQIGRICQGLQKAGVWDRTLLVLVSDHGMTSIYETGHVSMEQYLAEHYGLRVTGQRCAEPDYGDRLKFYDDYDVVIVPDAGRLVALHLRAAGQPWHHRPADAGAMQLAARSGRITVQQLAEQLAREPFARFVALRAGPNRVRLLGRKGQALVERAAARQAAPVADTPRPHDDTYFVYRIEQGEDPLRMGLDAATLERAAGAGLTGREWLERAADTPNPGVVSQIVGYMASPRVGDVVAFADYGYGFGPDVSGHGSTTPAEMFVPLALAGPGVEPGDVVEPVRIHSVMPTIMAYLGLADRLDAVPLLDGRILALRPAIPAARESGALSRSQE